MRRYITTLGALVICAMALAVLPAGCNADSGALTKNDVLTIQDGKFYLEGKRFSEISFNKFDLFWQLFSLLADGKGDTQEYRDMVARQDQALAELHQMGFR